MVKSSLTILFLLLSGSLSAQLFPAETSSPAQRRINNDDSLIAIGSGKRNLGSNHENMETPYYRVGPFGWLTVAVHEQHDGVCYPTHLDCTGPGYFTLDACSGLGADFNGDGLEDLLLTWSLIPHTIDRLTKPTFSILLNDGKGGLTYAPEMFDNSAPPVRLFAYRTAIADFNMDGKPDIVASSMGMIRRNPDLTTTTMWEPIPLALSTPEGKLTDASANIQGQEDGGLPEGFTFGHDLSVGDVNGDGAPDFFTGKCLFLNDVTGQFTNATALLPQEISPNFTYLMTSLIGDLDGDGIDDIVSAYADGSPGDPSGYILLSNGNTSFNNRQIVALPPGLFGAGTTKFNHGAIYDVNNDGRPDIVFSTTRANPYYEGRLLQVIINHGNGVFLDETIRRVAGFDFLNHAQGEGSLYVVDVNGDGIPDLVHSAIRALRENDPHSITVYLNANGTLRAQHPSLFAWVHPWQIEGFGEDHRWYSRSMGRAYPINLDNQAGIDFAASVITPFTVWPPEDPDEFTFYSILSVKPLIAEDYFGLEQQSFISAGGDFIETGGTLSFSAGLPDFYYYDAPGMGSLQFGVQHALFSETEDVPVQLDDFTWKQQLFKVFPNPTAENFTIEMNHFGEETMVSVEVFGLRGEKILSEKVTADQPHVFSLSGRQSGLYIIRVVNGNQTGIERIIKR